MEAHNVFTAMSGSALVTVMHARSRARRLRKTQEREGVSARWRCRRVECCGWVREGVMREGGVTIVWVGDGWVRVGVVADQSEGQAGFAEAQLAAYGIRRFEKACGMSFICACVGTCGCECSAGLRTEVSLAGYFRLHGG